MLHAGALAVFPSPSLATSPLRRGNATSSSTSLVRGDLAKSVTSLHANWAEPSARLGHGREHRRLHVLWRPGVPRLPRRARIPRDRFYRPITRIATLGQRRRLDKATSGTGCSTAPAGRAPQARLLRLDRPRCVAHMVWLVVAWSAEHDNITTAAKHLAQAHADG